MSNKKEVLKNHGMTFYATCLRCGHKWDPPDIDKQPKECPACKSVKWNTKRSRAKTPIYKAPEIVEQPIPLVTSESKHIKKSRIFAKPIDSKPESVVKPPNLVKKTYTRRLMMLVIAGLLIGIGLVMFAVYFFTTNMVFGAPSIFLIGGGVILFKYYWGKTGDTVIQHIGEVNKVQVNSLCLYPDRIVFENINDPTGFPQQCLNDKKNYYVLKWDEAIKRLVPFVLPDQQYYDPGVFAERVLELPAHQKIFTRKPNLFQKIKTGLLVLAIGIVWLLILTTTG